MHRLRLSTLLVGVNVGLLLLAVAGVAVVAVNLLQQLAGEQALARVDQAAVTARQEIDDTGQAMATYAQLLAERPTLRRLLDQDDRVALAAFLDQFQATGQLDGAAVLENGRPVATGASTLPWSTLLPAPAEAAPVIFRPDPAGGLLLGASAPVTGDAGRVVVVARRLDAAFAAALGLELGLPIAIVSAEGAPEGVDGERGELRTRALSGAAAGLANRDEYLAVVPLTAPSGAVVGLVEATLPAASITRSAQQLVIRLIIVTVAVCLLAAAMSLALGRRLARPLQALSGTAAAIGRGDLRTPVALAAGAEIGTLAATLEEMRRRLLRLTDDLRRQQAEANAIVTGIVEGVFSVDRQRRIQYLNPQAAALLGTTPEAAVGRFCGDVLYRDGSDGIRPCAERCPILHARFRGGARATEHVLLPDGSRRTVVITSASAIDDKQMQVMRDETEIEATRRLRDAILANISHEFRTPLSAQLASIELLLDQLPALSAEQIAELVRAQQRGALRLTQLIDNLLESARLEAGHDTIRRGPVALDEVLEDALESTHPLLRQRNQSVEVDLPYPLPPVSGDARRLTQVFVNLLGNANKFAPAGSSIHVGAAVERATITISVSDQGPGLPAVAGQALFKRFVRTSDEEPEQSGVGLGLWLVKSIVERHGGRVEAQTVATGTRMSVILPLDGTASALVSDQPEVLAASHIHPDRTGR